MAHVSENSIKKVALGFLKTYYRFRPRASETRASINMRTQGGIIADGIFSFQKENGQTFLATFEATSYETREEVFYQLQNTLLWWDSIAVSSILTAFLFSFSQRYEAYTPHQIGLFSLLLVVGLSLIAFTLLYRLLFGWLRKYRYVYAIEQFKHYHADEQWIAIADDVFQLPLELDFLEELKNQCVINGFGLISVDRELQPHLLITPSREELFKGQRKITRFFDESSRRIGLTNSRVTSWWKKLIDGLGLGSHSVSDSTSLLRFQRSYFHQVILCLIAFGVLAGVFYKQWQDKPFEYVDEKLYEQQMDSISRTLHPDISMETTLDKFDTTDYRQLEPVEEVIGAANDRDELTGAAPSQDDYPANTAAGEIYVSRGTEEMTSYNCERFYNFRGTVYLVQENTYALLGDAQQRLDLFVQKGIPAGLIWLGCFSATEDDYVIYYDLWYDSREEAKRNMNRFRNLLKKHNLNSDNVQLRSISNIAE
jgi:hypothetical protein